MAFLALKSFFLEFETHVIHFRKIFFGLQVAIIKEATVKSQTSSKLNNIPYSDRVWIKFCIMFTHTNQRKLFRKNRHSVPFRPSLIYRHHLCGIGTTLWSLKLFLNSQIFSRSFPALQQCSLWQKTWYISLRSKVTCLSHTFCFRMLEE